ncbi:MAG: aminodeoxychorismate synthase component I [Woeseiaceae bacterium]
MISTLLPAGADLHALHRFAPERYPFLLQSTAADAALGSHDILMLASSEALRLDATGVVSGYGSEGHTGFLTALDAWWQREQVNSSDGDWPFSGGWFLYLGYELAAEIEPNLTLQADPILPAAFAVRCRAALIREHSTGNCYFVAEDDVGADVHSIRSDIEAAAGAIQEQFVASQLDVAEEPASDFLEAVVRAKEYIASGDIYQANLSRGWSATCGIASPDNIYRALCEANPGPFAGLIHWEGVSVVSSSPERLLRIRDGIASTRPIAGTRPRSDNATKDAQLIEELIGDPKERAEHVMLIDLERNDLGRVCEAGSVEVDEMMIVESYAHVHHIVSNVCGKLRDDVTPGEAIAAVFPGGTITGCPKVRCMEIISELETGPRGAYTGSFGYLNLDGSLDLNILIRTIVVNGTEIALRAGSGIVADSQPEAELNETRAKAKGLIRALSQ